MKERICCLENELIVKNSIIKNQQKDIDKLRLVQRDHQSNYYTFQANKYPDPPAEKQKLISQIVELQEGMSGLQKKY